MGVRRGTQWQTWGIDGTSRKWENSSNFRANWKRDLIGWEVFRGRRLTSKWPKVWIKGITWSPLFSAEETIFWTSDREKWLWALAVRRGPSQGNMSSYSRRRWVAPKDLNKGNNWSTINNGITCLSRDTHHKQIGHCWWRTLQVNVNLKRYLNGFSPEEDN